jgi:NarL family two-component system response regulator LiaR
MDKKIRVIIGDKHELFREGLRLVIKRDKDFDCAGIAKDIDSVTKLVKELSPDIILLDVCLLNGELSERNRNIKALSDLTKVIILTHSEEDGDILHSLQMGVKGYLLKDIGYDHLMTALRTVYAGEQVLCPAAVAKISAILQKEGNQQGTEDDDLKCPLKKRELEVLSLAAEGMTNKAIASKLNITEHTVASHLVNIFRKLGVGSRTEAVLRGIEQKWFPLKSHD